MCNTSGHAVESKELGSVWHTNGWECKENGFMPVELHLVAHLRVPCATAYAYLRRVFSCSIGNISFVILFFNLLRIEMFC